MINNSSRGPLATLRGHDDGVTALAQCDIDGNPYLVSGDEGGSVIVWDLVILRKSLHYSKLVVSRTQCLKVITLSVAGIESKILVAQSRNDGIQLINLTEAIKNNINTVVKPIETYSTYSALFSKCDTINLDNAHAILAHPSCLENHLVTVRLIGDDAKTLHSGSAQRFSDDAGRKSTVFDILIRESRDGQFLLFAAYEDGRLCLFTFHANLFKTLPVLNSTGLKIDLIKEFDLKIGDFLSAYDVMMISNNNVGSHFLAICGSPLKHLTFLSYDLDEPDAITSNDVPLGKKGVSSICISPDKKLVAIACWNATVRLYSLESKKFLATLDYHAKQVQSILFIEEQETHQYLTLSRDGGESAFNSNANEKRYLMCCASMEGTISISAVY